MDKYVIFGATSGGYNLSKYLTDIEIIAYCDNDSSKWGVIGELPIIGPVDLEKYDYDYIVIGSSAVKEITAQLVNDLGIAKDKVIDFYHGETFDARVAALRSCAEEIKRKNIEGNTAELGVYKGDFAVHINKEFPEKTLYLFDTFEGFAPEDIEMELSKVKEIKVQDGKIEDKFIDTSVEFVLSRMQYRDKCVVKKGYFPESLEGLEDKYCFVSLDADLYLPILEGLKYFYPRLSKGGYIFIHDVDGFEYPGAKKAVHEYCDANDITVFYLNDKGGSAVVVK